MISKMSANPMNTSFGAKVPKMKNKLAKPMNKKEHMSKINPPSKHLSMDEIQKAQDFVDFRNKTKGQK